MRPCSHPHRHSKPTGARPCASASPRATVLYAAEWSADARDDDLHTIPGTQTLWLELAVAARYEAVHHLDDLLLRRTRLGLLLPRGGLDHLPRIQALCAPHLAWEAARWADEAERYRALIAAHYQPPSAAA
ncbi:MAG: glycerol-3-phosphate dehydrogenase C-terminal domain-containing protein [Giesbergeria sp.]